MFSLVDKRAIYRRIADFLEVPSSWLGWWAEELRMRAEELPPKELPSGPPVNYFMTSATGPVSYNITTSHLTPEGGYTCPVCKAFVHWADSPAHKEIHLRDFRSQV